MCSFMREHEYDALAVTSADWFEWASNHSVTELAWERPFLLVVTVEGKTFALLSELSRNAIAAERRRGTLWIDSVDFYAESAQSSRHRWTTPRWRDMVVETLKAAGLSDSRVAADGLNDWLAQSVSALPHFELCMAHAGLRDLRFVKHPHEVDTMRLCASLSDWAIDAYREELKPGRLLAEVDHLIAAKLAAEAARRLPGENYVIARLLTLSGAASAAPHGDGIQNGKTLENDTVANTTIATRLNGLSVELSRPWLVGRPDAATVRFLDCALAAQGASIEAAVAGRPVSGIHDAAQALLDREGCGAHLRLRAGHGIGVVMHDYPVDVPFNPRLLIEGETYAVEPGLFIADVGAFRFADTIAVGAGSPEQLTQASKQRVMQTLR
jgi:Xaa-Pro aminopeptidase